MKGEGGLEEGGKEESKPSGMNEGWLFGLGRRPMFCHEAKKKGKEMECLPKQDTNSSPCLACSLMSLLPLVEGECMCIF